MLSHFKLLHLLPLSIATIHAVGGFVWPLVDQKGAILGSGLPQRVADSPAAQSVFTLASIRLSALGSLIWVLYLQRKLKEVDTVNIVLGIWLEFADTYVHWLEGETQQAVLRAKAGLLIAGWGAAGLTYL